MTERRQASFANSPDDETWLDFLRSAGGTAPSSSSRATDRPSVLSPDSADRKRRLTSAEHGRNYPYTAPGSDRHIVPDRPSAPRRPSHSSNSTSLPRSLSNSSSSTSPPRRPLAWGSMARRRSSDLPPPWQPDAQVSKCPVCEQDFTFLFRKHHCRKCGRVVCANCSPHRITIPREYIVQPPGTTEPPFQYIGGAEVVRVCKPCVPDPWSPQIAPQQHPPPAPSDPCSRTTHHGPPRRASEASQSRYHRRPSVAVPPRPAADDSRFPSYRDFMPARASLQAPTAESARTLYSVPRPRGLTAPTAQPQPSRADPPQAFSRPTQRRHVKEEDECPVCGIELPPGASVREAHISDCVTSRFSTPPPPSTHAPIQPTNPHDPNLPSGSGSTSPSARVRATSYRSRGIFPYIATEKDCVDGEGREQECTICMEEFESGDEMGRLECLCKFHRACIREWWARKGAGSCPVHVSNE